MFAICRWLLSNHRHVTQVIWIITELLPFVNWLTVAVLELHDCISDDQLLSPVCFGFAFSKLKKPSAPIKKRSFKSNG